MSLTMLSQLFGGMGCFAQLKATDEVDFKIIDKNFDLMTFESRPT
jgi:hypothetical protein